MNREQRRPHLGVDGLPSTSQRRTNRDHMTNEARPLPGESAGDQSPEAVTDDNNLAAFILRNVFQTTQHALDLALRAPDIDAYPRQVSPITDLLKPWRHRVEGPVAGSEARNQKDRLAFAFGNILAVKERIRKKG